MVKKQNNITWLTWVLAVIAIVALILAIVAINKANITGQGIFSWAKSKASQQQEYAAKVNYNPPTQLNCEIKTSVDCMQSTNYSLPCDDCNEICGVFNKPICDYAGRGRFEGNFTAAPDYYEPINCDSETSSFVFRLYCNCCDN